MFDDHQRPRFRGALQRLFRIEHGGSTVTPDAEFAGGSGSARDLWLTALVSAAIIALAVVYYMSRWPDVRAFVLALDHCDKLFCDFTNHYYPMAVNLYTTRAPVAGYFYSPLFAVLLSPLRRLPQAQALQVWGGIQGALLLWFVFAPYLWFRRRSAWVSAGYVALVAFSQPVLHNLKWGQVSILMTLSVLLAFESHRHGRAVLAALVLALGVWIKFYTAIFLVYFLLKRDLKFLIAFAGAGVVLALVVPLTALGIGDGIGFYSTVSRAVGDAAIWIVTDVNSQHFVHVVNRYAGGTLSSSAMFVLRGVGYGVLALNLLLSALVVYRKLPHERNWVIVLLFASLPFVVGTTWPHYLVYLPFCHAVLALALIEDRGPRSGNLLKAGLLLLPSVVLSSAVFFNWIGDWPTYSSVGFLFLANSLVLILAYTQLWSLLQE